MIEAIIQIVSAKLSLLYSNSNQVVVNHQLKRIVRKPRAIRIERLLKPRMLQQQVLIVTHQHLTLAPHNTNQILTLLCYLGRTMVKMMV